MRAAVRLVGGLRPVALLALGAAWIVYGVRIVVDARYGVGRGLASITRYVPLSTLGWVWVAAGIVGVVSGLLPVYRWQADGFAALVAPAVLWGVTNLRAACTGYPAASGSAAAWLGFAAFALCTAGMVEPPWVVDAVLKRKGGTRV
jgi:hypothetical protein